MDIIFFAHPKFAQFRSMDSFAEMLTTGMKRRGHNVQLWYPEPVFSKLSLSRFTKKWLGYIDQYFIFPGITRRRLDKCNANTLFVFTDQALGPWVPLVQKHSHVVHCHDFHALCSAKGEIHENLTGWTGRIYQHFIHRGYSTGKNFISVSERTQEQLKRFLPSIPESSIVIYNGIKKGYSPYKTDQARFIVQYYTGINTSSGYILHVGGNQWYKNRIGVVEIYNAWRSNNLSEIPLLLIGDPPSAELMKIFNISPYKAGIHFLSGMDDDFLRFAYAGASVFLFPSLAEGFGWPIVEAMACGCKVITTREAPMTEVGGYASFYISRRPSQQLDVDEWALKSAEVVNDVINLNKDANKMAIKMGNKNIERFDAEIALSRIEMVYKRILKQKD